MKYLNVTKIFNHKSTTMQFKFITNEMRLEHLIKELPELKVIEKEYLPEFDTYEVTFQAPFFFDLGIIAQMFFRAGLSWGLDLKYSSYDNNISR